MKKIVILFLLFITLPIFAETLFFDDFEAGLNQWTVQNNGGTGVWQIWGTPYPNTYTLPAPSSGNVASADADEDYPIDCELIIASPLDLITYENIFIDFDNDFNAIDSDDWAYVDVSNDGGSTWNNVIAWNDDVRETHESVDISTYASLNSNVLIRFYSIQPGWDWWWAIDNVEVSGNLAITYDNDLAAIAIDGNTLVNGGNSENYDITVKNVGVNTQNDYSVKLYKNGSTEIASLDITTPIAADEEVVHTLVWQIPADEPQGTVTIHGEVELAGDENASNNDTNDLSVEVFPPGIVEIQVGTGTENNNRTPVCFQYLNSLTEMLYFEDELNYMTGMITELTFEYDFSNNISNSPISIWLGMTTQTNLTSGWIPSTSLDLVFDGTVGFASGTGILNIELDTPYFYEGNNLVMMVHRPMDTTSYPGSDDFLHSETPANLDRTRYERDNTMILDPASPPTGYSFEKFPNTLFTFYQGEMGNVEGYVMDDQNNPLSGADVEIEELQMVTYTDNQGYYYFGNVLVGTYNFTANKFGYSPQTTQAEVLQDQTISIDFALPALGTVDVSGHVVGSDDPNTGLDGAFVTLDGFEYYEIYTDANGDFTISGVYTNITYDLEIDYDDYETLYDEVEVGAVNLDLGTITINEMAFPPGNVVATQNDLQTEAYLNWNSPGQGGGEFRYDDGTVDFQIGFSTTPPNGVFGAAYPYMAVIQEVQWYLTSNFGTHDDVKILILGLDVNDEPDVDQVYLSTGLIDNIDDEWNSYVLDQQITALGGFFVGVITPNEYTSVALDDGVGEPWVFQSGTQFSNENWLGGNTWTDIGTISSMFQKNMLIRAYGVNMGHTDTAFPIFAKNKPDTFNNREFESYNVYRFQSNLVNNPDLWDLVGEAITDTMFTDTSWASLPLNTYQFAVTSVHTNGVESMPAFSAELEKTIAGSDPQQIPVSSNELFANYPNPFNPNTTISFNISDDNSGNVILEIFNMKGQKVKTLLNEQMESGLHFAQWNGTNDRQKPVSSGIYFYKLKTENYSSTKKMILMK
ncbi:MAG: carboxypeptidase regulatory-like domain-containing protein [Candidatus Cloacimonetes bacterium]|nr:carboxypeptidase regulatory-like domain-containing protein [Candidatus Cloacimonadota bacterium]MCF7814148.1 carboxypeptidase regulatory-like domain-containing protein [Candidatus Cloacimonadota bacterium]MCF7868753.1 carboxypeptidase regulatory-like domain-containing protein [Candidatus Cloacimonadota bacterium]MCF7884147.1 carboxypeptidase regulatory-like domain-containing protein [Candidatus Cloacimonadota bacterium]